MVKRLQMILARALEVNQAQPFQQQSVELRVGERNVSRARGGHMVAKYFLALVGVAALAAKSGAQGVNPSRPADFVFTPSAEITAETNTPLFLRSIKDAERGRQRQGVTVSGVKECPMPVQRPDTSRLIRMPNIHLSPGITHMPRFDLNCPNPLDPGRHIQRSPNWGYPKEF